MIYDEKSKRSRLILCLREEIYNILVTLVTVFKGS
jgi:hypothetical protein